MKKKLPWLMTVYGMIIAGFCLTFGIGVFAMTLEPDESWILMSTMKAFGIPLPPTSAVDHPVTTSGGLHLLLHGLIAQGWGRNIFVHRLVSVAVTLVLLGIVFKGIEYQVKNRALAAAGTALFATAPGFLLQASLATAEIVATTLFLLAVLFWVRFGARSASMALLGGVIFGLACATRMTCLSMLPAILVWSVVVHRGWLARFVYPMLCLAMALFVFTGLVAAYFYAFDDSSMGGLWENAKATGLSRSFDGVFMRLNYIVVGDGIIPVMAIVALAAWFIIKMDTGRYDRKLIGLSAFLLFAGCAGWLAWVLKSPIAHIRYLWPAIPMLWLAAILLSLSALARVRQGRTLSIAHVSIILVCALQGLLNVRMLAVGDSLALVYEAARQSQLGTPGYFRLARSHQDEMASLLQDLPASANIYSFKHLAAYPMTYLSSRTIKPLQQTYKASAEDYLLVQPSDRSIWSPEWHLISWQQGNTTLVERRGRYELYRMREGAEFSDR